MDQAQRPGTMGAGAMRETVRSNLAAVGQGAVDE